MASSRRKFSSQFKAEAVQMVLETDKPVAEVARDLQINAGTLGNWVNTWRREHPEPEPEITPTERARVAEMEDEIRRLRVENEFLKKAAADSTGRRNTLTERVVMGRPAGWLRDLTGRNPMISPGAPSSRRSIEREFWKEIASGVSSEDAAAAVGVSPAVGTRWFRQGGGMPTITLSQPGGRYGQVPWSGVAVGSFVGGLRR